MIKISFVKEEDISSLVPMNHSHEEIEIDFIVSGTGSYLVESKEYHIFSGDVFFFPGNIIHKMVYINSKAHMSIVKIHFLPEDIKGYAEKNLVSSLTEAFYKADGNFNVRISGNTEIAKSTMKIAEQMYEDYEGTSVISPMNICLLTYILMKLKSYYCEHRGEEGRGLCAKCYYDIMRSVQYINDNYLSDISLDSIAAISMMSKNRYIINFKKFIGTTPNRYIVIKRINRAIDLIEKNEKSITEIAYECGFNSTANFNRSFLKVSGTTPMKMKKYKGKADVIGG